MGKYLRQAALTLANVDQIAQQIRDILAGNLFMVGVVRLDDYVSSIELHGSQRLMANWTDNSDDLVRVRRQEDEKTATLHFSGGAYSHVFIAHADDTPNHDNFRRECFMFQNRYEFTIKWRSPIGYLMLTTFKVYDQMEWDEDAYDERDLRLHFAAAGRSIPEYTAASKASVLRSAGLEEHITLADLAAENAEPRCPRCGGRSLSVNGTLCQSCGLSRVAWEKFHEVRG